MESWIKAIRRVQATAERAGYVCTDFVIRLIRWIVQFIKRLRDRNDVDDGEGYIRAFPKR